MRNVHAFRFLKHEQVQILNMEVRVRSHDIIDIRQGAGRKPVQKSRHVGLELLASGSIKYRRIGLVIRDRRIALEGRLVAGRGLIIVAGILRLVGACGKAEKAAENGTYS